MILRHPAGEARLNLSKDRTIFAAKAGRYVEFARPGHGMDVIGGRQDVRERVGADGEPNPEIGPVISPTRLPPGARRR